MPFKEKDSDNPEQKNLYDKDMNRMLDYTFSIHRSNKRAMRDGYIALLVLPVILLIFKNLINGDKVVFLLIWIICMFALAAFLVFVAYSDHELQAMLDEMSLTTVKMDGLMDMDELQEQLADIRRRRRSSIWSLRDNPVLFRRGNHKE